MNSTSNECNPLYLRDGSTNPCTNLTVHDHTYRYASNHISIAGDAEHVDKAHYDCLPGYQFPYLPMGTLPDGNQWGIPYVENLSSGS